MNSVALVVLASDSLEAVIPRYTSDQWKLLCFIVYVHHPPLISRSYLPRTSSEYINDHELIYSVLPLSFVPLRYLSLSSFIGVLTTWGIIGILIFSGVAT